MGKGMFYMFSEVLGPNAFAFIGFAPTLKEVVHESRFHVVHEELEQGTAEIVVHNEGTEVHRFTL